MEHVPPPILIDLLTQVVGIRLTAIDSLFSLLNPPHWLSDLRILRTSSQLIIYVFLVSFSITKLLVVSQSVFIDVLLVVSKVVPSLVDMGSWWDDIEGSLNILKSFEVILQSLKYLFPSPKVPLVRTECHKIIFTN